MRVSARRNGSIVEHDLAENRFHFSGSCSANFHSFQRVFSLVAWKIEALASASASLADAVALSNSPASAAFFAAASVAAVVVH